jgi:hypothetical protein
MPVKVIVKGKKEPLKEEAPKILPVQSREINANIFILTRIKKMFRIMLLDIRMTLNPKLKEEYQDYCRFAELARGRQ